MRLAETSVTNGAARREIISNIRIEVRPKSDSADPAGAEVLRLARGTLGLRGLAAVRTSSLYEFTGDLSLPHAERIARELLADPITQEFAVASTRSRSGPRPANGRGNPGGPLLKRIEVWLMPEVTDPVAASVLKGIRDLGLADRPAALEVRCGTGYQLEGRVSPADLNRLATQLLFNPLVHLCKIY